VLAGGRLRAASGAARALRALALFAVYAAGVLVYRVARPLATVESGAFESRFGATGDGVAKYVYLLLAVFAFVLCSYAAYRDERLYVRVWVVGALVAAAYTWLLFAGSALGAPPLLLPGMEKPQYVALGGRLFIRSGTFQEGNYLGLYLVCSVAVAIYGRRFVAAALLSATTLVTFSTVNVIALAVLWLGVGWSAATSRREAASRAAAVLTVATTGYATEIVYAKLGASDSISKIERLDQALAGLRMFLDHPLGGVGLSQYAYHYPVYQITGAFNDGEYLKIIANNVYVELLAETGIVGALLFVAFLVGIARRARAPGLAPLWWGLVAMLLVFNAFPTYTIVFLWAYWALIVAAAAQRRDPGGARLPLGQA
jgi:O-antigen ligase